MMRLPSGKYDYPRHSLRTTDETEARAQAHALWASLLQNVAKEPIAPPASQAIATGTLTLGQLVSRYLQSEAFVATKKTTQEGRKQALEVLLDFPDDRGRPWREMVATKLDNEQVRRYVRARRTGAYTHARVLTAKASDRTIQHALATLRAACHWAYATKVGDRRLVPERVFDGIDMPGEGAPKQPRMSQATFEKLLDVSRTMHPTFGLMLRLAEALGNRLSSIRQLRWEDVLWDDTRVVWQAEFDKEGNHRWSPLPDHILDALKAEQRRQEAEGIETPWVCPKPTDPTVPVGKRVATQWLERAYDKAKLPKPEGGGWHQLRRKWKSDRRHLPDALVMKAGGWKSRAAFDRYDQPTDDELLAVVLNRRAS
jgi:integrase